MKPVAFETLQVGDTAEFRHTVTKEDVLKFANLTGDDNALHVDPEFAAKTSFKGVVAHGMLGASFISTVIGKYLPGNGSLWISQNFEFLLPTRIGDTLTISAEILKKHKTQRIITLKTEIKNQHKQVVLTGEGKIKVLQLEESKSDNIKHVETRVVLITGASKGIGAATAVTLASQGFSVIINYCSDKTGAQNILEQIRKNQGDAIICRADVTKSEEVKKMVSLAKLRFGTITALVNNATSKIIPQTFEELEWRDIELHMNIQLKGAFNCIQAVLPDFQKNKMGSVVNINSIYSDSTPPDKMAGYVMTKNALSALTKSLAVEYGPQGIRFNTVSPGMTETGLISDIPEKTRLVTSMNTPLRRLAQPLDIADAISFLLSDKAKHITGETLRVCGGAVMI